MALRVGRPTRASGHRSPRAAADASGLRFDAPLLDARDLHGRVVNLELGLQLESGNSHGLLRTESPAKRSLAFLTGQNKSATQIWPATNALHSPAGTS